MPDQVTKFRSDVTGKLYDSYEQCREEESASKLLSLQSRIARGVDWVPQTGDLIYVDSHMYIDHGEDDVVGGLAIVKGVDIKDYGTFVYVHEHRGHGYNWKCLLGEQKKLQAEFGKKYAYPDPDYGG